MADSTGDEGPADSDGIEVDAIQNCNNHCSPSQAKEETSHISECSNDDSVLYSPKAKDNGQTESDTLECSDLTEADITFSNCEGKKDGGLMLSTLKKDDSGIDIEKSPTSISAKEMPLLSDAEGSEGVGGSLTDSSRANSLGEPHGDDISKMTDERNGVSNADIRDGELILKCHDVDTDACGDILPDIDDSNSSMTDATMANEMSNLIDSSDILKRRRPRVIDSSSSDSSGSDHAAEEEIRPATDSEDEEAMEVDPRKKPKDIWHAVRTLTTREFGYTNKTPSSIFRDKVAGSLQMVQRFKLQYKMDYHEGCVNALNFNRIGTLLASGSDDLNIVLWNWIRNRPALVFDSGHRANVFQAKFMPFSGDCHVVSCARDGQVRLAELSLTGVCKATKKLAQHRGAAHKLALELDSPHVFLSCGEDAVTFEIDLRQEKPNKLVTTKENDRKIALYSIHSNPCNSYEFCVGGRDHYIRIYDTRRISEDVNGGVLKKFCPHHLIDSDIKANVTCAAYNYNGTEVMGTYNDEDIYLFDNSHSDGAEYVKKYNGHRNNATVKGVNFFGPKSEFIVSGSDCGHIFIWDKETEKIVQFLEGDEGGVINVLEPHPFAPILATSGLDHDVKVWSPTSIEGTKLNGLKTQIKKNRRDRDEERTHEPEMMDGQMLWFLMHHLRRSSRRRARQEGEAVSSSSGESDSESDDSEDMSERMQCAQS